MLVSRVPEFFPQFRWGTCHFNKPVCFVLPAFIMKRNFVTLLPDSKKAKTNVFAQHLKVNYRVVVASPGQTLYHGTGHHTFHLSGIRVPQGPAWFSIAEAVAEFFAKDRGDTNGTAYILTYMLLTPLRLLDLRGQSYSTILDEYDQEVHDLRNLLGQEISKLQEPQKQEARGGDDSDSDDDDDLPMPLEGDEVAKWLLDHADLHDYDGWISEDAGENVEIMLLKPESHLEFKKRKEIEVGDGLVQDIFDLVVDTSGNRLKKEALSEEDIKRNESCTRNPASEQDRRAHKERWEKIRIQVEMARQEAVEYEFGL
jgi:hypothetical protein